MRRENDSRHVYSGLLNEFAAGAAQKHQVATAPTVSKKNTIMKTNKRKPKKSGKIWVRGVIGSTSYF